MKKLDIREIRQEAAQILRDTQPDYRKLVLRHSAVAMGVWLVAMLIQFWVGDAMSQTGGLADMGLRSILGTVESTVTMAVSFLQPFWQMGILFTSLLVVRGQQAGFSQLTRGFQRLIPLLKYQILMAIYLMLAAFGCSYVASFLTVSFTDTQALMEVVERLPETALTDPQALMESLPIEQLMPMVLTMLGIFLVLFGAVAAFISYRFFMAPYFLLDAPNPRARLSLRFSSRLTKGNKWQLVKLDLSFWWYYLLLGVAVSVAYLPDLLPGIQALSVAQIQMLGNILYALANVGIQWLGGGYVQTARACAFEKLRQMYTEDAPGNA